MFSTSVVELEKAEYDHPIVIGGFIGPTLVGLLSASYIIEQMQLHQIAHVKSRYIPPVAVFVGEKLRHPFRIYKDKTGKVIVMICEVPIDDYGLYEISSALLDWFEKLDPTEITILDGAPTSGIPSERKTYCVTEEERLDKFKERGMEIAESALITGVGGSILNECLVRKVVGTSLLSPASVNFPDPGAVLSIIQSVNSLYDLKIDTNVLEASVTQLHKDVNAIVENYKKLREKKKISDGPESMYG